MGQHLVGRPRCLARTWVNTCLQRPRKPTSTVPKHPARFYLPAFTANLTSTRIPALTGVPEKLQAGARVADVGCGHGISTLLLVEPLAGDRLADNLTPLGRAYYAASTLNCVPTSLSQPRGLALGAQAGEARLRDIATRAGFSRFRRAIEVPFNLVIEARP